MDGADSASPLWVTVLASLLVLVLTGGCSTTDGRTTATWRLADGETLTRDTTTFTALVSRLDCNNGVTGEVNDPVLDETDEDVVITFTVSPDDPPAADCPSNDEVPYEVQLPRALGQRSVVDGACALPEASTTSTCQPDGVRFSP